ncbi:MAG: hypothetical protein EXS14_01940 [Planctomycetes bacterium]|nr:hypothetical protein [Planctomycetota bacterium]
MTRRGRVLLCVALGAVLLCGTLLLRAAAERTLTAPIDFSSTAYAGSAACQQCHSDRHASWSRTFHRTMTQEATPESVEGVFDGRELSFEGQPVRLRREGPLHSFEYLDKPGGTAVRSLPIVRTVGSRRYQQYLVSDPTAQDNSLWRAPLLWHIEERRWMHLNGAFLGHDGMPFDKHLTLWNQNCIFCHNTGAAPRATNIADLQARESKGESVDVEQDLRFRSQVAELGIGCEACHGPGAEHVQRQTSWAATMGDRTLDVSIINPRKLSPERSTDVCAQCHAGRVPRQEVAMLDWLVTGHPFRPGDNLQEHVNFIRKDTPVPGRGSDDPLFSLRFWNDGTPRLSAYEAQGLTASRCAEGGLTCIDCHSMHAGDPKGMILPSKRTAAACARCHQDITRDAAAHSLKTAGCASTDCYECHMPRMVYGVMDIHRSHKIERPDPAGATATGRPDACTNCHMDRSPSWAAEQLRAHGAKALSADKPRADGASIEHADGAASLHAGDALRRAVAARLAGNKATALRPEQRAWMVPHLLITLSDGWPSVRFQAWRSLRALDSELRAAGIVDGWGEALTRFDPQGPREQRRAVQDELLAAWSRADKRAIPQPPASLLLDSTLMPRLELIRVLLALQVGRIIDIGE